MGRVNDLFKGIFSKNSNEVVTNDNEVMINNNEEGITNVEDISSMQDSEEVYYPSRENLLSLRDQFYDYMEMHGMTVNDMQNGDVPEFYTKDFEEPIDESKYIYVDDPEDLADYEYDYEKYEIKYVGESKYLEEISNMLDTKLEFENYAPELLTEIENAEYMIDGINSHYGRDKIYQFNFINKDKDIPILNVTFTDDQKHVYSKNDIEKLVEKDNSKQNIYSHELDQEEWIGKEESDISNLRMGDMSFNYKNLKDEKIKDFTILSEVDSLNIGLKDGTDLKVYNNTEEKEQFNRYLHHDSNSSINVNKLDITVKDYMDYTIDKNNDLSDTNSIDKHVEKHLQNSKEKRKSKHKDIEL